MENRNKKETTAVLLAFFVSGAAALIYEVIWTRALSLVLGSTVYAMSTMLSTFMAGLAIGSYCGGKLSDRDGNLLFFFAVCELGIGVCGLASIPLIYRLPAVYLHIYREFHLYPPVYFTVQILLCAAVMLVPTTLMGATFPLVSRRITVSLAEMGKKVGDAYSVNTVGAVIGSLAVGFFLIPTFGIKGASVFAASLNLLIGVTMLLIARKGMVKALLTALPLFGITGAWNGNSRLETSLVNFYGASREIDAGSFRELVDRMRSNQKEVFYEEYPQGPVRAFKDRTGSLLLQVGGKVEGTATLDVPNTVLLAYLPIASHPAPKNFLTIGLGAGVTLAAAKEQVKEADLVEINPGVLKAVRLHGKPGLLDGVNIIVNDARNYLLTTDKKYDIISSEPSYPTEFEVASLFTRDFFEIAAGKLNRNGIYCQWLPYYILSTDDVTTMIRTFSMVFPNACLWKIPQSRDLILIGSMEPFSFMPDEIRERVGKINNHRYPLNFILSRGQEQVAEIARKAEFPINCDDKPILEFSAVNNMLLGDVSEKNRESLMRSGK